MQFAAYLAEPRDELENDFINKLTAANNMFYLGCTDEKVEGRWMWASDGTPVTWTNWMVRGAGREDEPNGGTEENCAVMLKQTGSGERAGAWGDYPCHDTGEPMIIVCESGKSYWRIDVLE